VSRLATATVALLAAVGVAACERGDRAARDEAAPDAPAARAEQAWPEPGRGMIDVERVRAVDLTGDGAAERVSVTARGARYEDLDIRLAITGARRDTLWAEAWRSDYYFHYDPMEGKSAQEIAALVQAHVDDLVAEGRFHPRGMPEGMMGGDPSETMRESVRYHLAELDWRRGADLEPAELTPPDAYRRIEPGNIAPERVQAVLQELLQGPTYNYFAGGEASYVLGWSAREQSFVRLFACC
jgi:hypothetical protein